MNRDDLAARFAAAILAEHGWPLDADAVREWADTAWNLADAFLARGRQAPADALTVDLARCATVVTEDDGA